MVTMMNNRSVSLKQIAEQLKNIKSALIFCHINPDGDTLSCAFSLKRALEKLNVCAKVVSPDGLPKKYEKLGFFDEVLRLPDGEVYDAFISVDCSTEGQMGEPYLTFSKHKNTFCIDHHISNSRYAKQFFVEDCGACAMLVYDLIKYLGVDIDAEMANILMVGVMTDTGNFSHSNTDQKVFETATELTKLGADVYKLNKTLFCSQPIERSKLYIEVMSKMKLFHDGKLAVISIFDEQMKRFNLTKSDTEGFIDFPMSIDGVEVAVSIFENGNNSFKISFRSKDVNVNEIAGVFGGGGHVKASGAKINGFYEDVLDKLVFTVGNYL